MLNQMDFPYGTCTTAAATADKVVNISDGHFVLKEGCTVFINFTNANSAAVGSITLNINGTGAKNIKYINQANLPSAGYIRANQTIMFTYDGTYWIYMSNIQYNTDTVDRLQQKGAIKAKTAIAAGNIIVSNDDTGYYHLKSNLPFDIRHPILAAGSKISAGSTGTNNFISIPFTVTTTQSITLTAYTPLYIEGTLNGTTFTPVSATPLKQSSFTAGKHYILLGYVYNSTTAAYLLPEHPVFIATSTTELKSFTSVANSVSNKLKIFIEDTDSSSTCTSYDGSTEESVTIPSAGPLTFGTVSIYDQTFAGVKKFKDPMIVNKSIYNAIFIGNGATGYYKVAQIQIKKTYADKVISFEFIRRVESSSTKVEIQFNSSTTLDPTLKVFRTIGPCDKVYIKKTDTSTWDLYIEKQQAYDSMTVFNYQNPYDSYGDTIVLTWYTQLSASASAISGWTQAGYNSLVTSVNQSIANSTPISYGNKTSSYIKINFYNGNNRIMICWGVVNSSSEGFDGDISDATVVFPTSYGNSNYIPTVLLQPINSEFMVNNPNDNVGFSLSSVTYSNFVVQFPSSKIFERAKGFYWFSIGRCT